MTRARIALLASVAIALFISAGCKPKLLPNSSVKDSSTNRAIADFMKDYKRAMESRSVDHVLALVADNYYDNNGTENPSDDLDYDELQKKLSSLFARVKDLKLSFHIQNIEEEGDNYNVVYHFVEHALVALPTGEKWLSATDVNKMVLRSRGKSLDEGFEIVAGL